MPTPVKTVSLSGPLPTQAGGTFVYWFVGEDVDVVYTAPVGTDPTDFAGWSLILTCRLAYGGAVLFSYAGVHAAPPSLQVTFTVPASATALLLPATSDLSVQVPPAGYAFPYPLDVWRTNFGDGTALASAELFLQPSALRLAAPTFTSAAAIAFTPGTAGTFTVTTTGTPTAALSVSGSLPTGVTFTDNGNGTGTLAGTPAAGTDLTSPYPLTFTANNGVGVTTQPFTLTINPLPLGSAIFASVLSQYLSRTNPALLSPGANPFSFACWAKLTTTITTSENLAGKWNPTGNQREWLVGFEAIGFRFRVSANGTTSIIDFTNANVTPVVGTWYRLLFTWDGTTATIYVNGGNAATSVNAGTVFQGTADFVLGANSQPGTFFTGEQARAAFWSRALSAGDAVTDYNGGHSFRYATLPAGLLVGNVAWWDETEAVGTTRLDSSANGLNLTDHNGVNLDPAGPP